MTVPLAPPSGMRDLLPPEATARAQLVSQLTGLFGRWGYERVTTPPFEHADVIERGLDTLDRRELLRFVEPGSGEVALLRPDITPQIARMVSTRFHDRPPPHRLCYAGSVIRLQRGRARRRGQILQAGVELLGLDGPSGDVESIALACHALELVGLESFVVELSLVGLTRSVLAEVPLQARRDVEAALVRKDRAELNRVLRRVGASPSVKDRLSGAATLHGGLEVLRPAARLFGSAPELRELKNVVNRARDRGLASRLHIDLGEVRGASYYTGVSFRLLARGPGEPLGAGGRYDGLMGRFGAAMPATGFGLDVENVEWALRAAGRPFSVARPPRFIVAGGTIEAREAIVKRLRQAGSVAVALDVRGRRRVLDYLKRWDYDAAVTARGESPGVERQDGAQRKLPKGKLEALGRWAKGRT